MTRPFGPLRPPKALGGRIRWLFLGFGLFNLAAVVPRSLAGHAAPPLARAGAVAAAIVLGLYWLQRYRRQTFPPWAIPLEGAAVGIVAVGLHDWLGTIGRSRACRSAACTAPGGTYSPSR
ncbi:hypothetical protein [Dactylosporangium sp. CA-139066]|uniref:hypothetical protein n=1 Tax=Dactylosporangium sp. CA-139066 TaxID=3239930 RepID=UPI003D8EED95